MLNLLSTAATAFTGLASVALFGSVAIETYVRIPQRILYGSDPPLLPSFTEEALFLVFPGYGGPDLNTERIEAVVAESDKVHEFDRKVFCYDWRNWRGNSTASVFRAAFDSQRVGRRVGEQLGSMRLTRGQVTGQRPINQIKDIHVVGISAGAFAADACIKEYKRALLKLYGPKAAATSNARLTLLDPFTCRGVTGTTYGAKYFGLEADYFENYVNTDDPVPFTNDPLPNAYNYDVTGSKQRDSFEPLPGDSMHSWPVAYFGLNWRDKIDTRRRGLKPPDHNSNPRGVTVKL